MCMYFHVEIIFAKKKTEVFASFLRETAEE